MSGPVTYPEASGGNIVDQMVRYRQLAEHDALAGAIAIGKARGTYEPNEYVNEQKYPPLTVAEHLEMLALGERIARYYRHPSQVDKAVRAGASWDQIAAAAGTTAEEARAAYREWAEGQHRLHADIGIGLDDAGYAAAVKAASNADAGRRPLSAELNARRAAAAVLSDYKAALASAPLTNPPGRKWMFRLASVLEDLLAMLGEQAGAGDGEDGARP
jgi:hypothetical protein